MALALLFLLSVPILAKAESIGVCYGRLGNNLPPDSEVIALYKANGITNMRLYSPNPSTLDALKGSNIQLSLDVPGEQIRSLADPPAASMWVQTNILAYSPAVKFRYISVGNEIDPTDPLAQFLLPAMQNLHTAISTANLQDQIHVSTTIKMSLLGTSYPPSAGSFTAAASPFMVPIITFLAQTGSPLLANVHPFLSYAADPDHIRLDYALFTAPGVVVEDGSLGYQNLFDATVDAVYSAVEKAGGAGVEVVVAESGWPSFGGNAATVENARVYYRNLMDRVQRGEGTLKRPERSPQVYLFAMFDENLKEGDESERHFGLFTHDEQNKYQISFTSKTNLPKALAGHMPPINLFTFIFSLIFFSFYFMYLF